MDNTQLNAGTGGDVIATDELTTLNGGATSGVKVQRVKVGFGSDGALRDVDASNGLPVETIKDSVVSDNNSSTAPLGASGVFTGVSQDCLGYATIAVSVFSNVASATNGLSIQYSTDGTNWDFGDTYTIPAATGKQFAVGIKARYLRVVYTNGGSAQSSFRLQTLLKKNDGRGSSQRPSDSRPNDNDMEEVISYNMGYDDVTNTWSRQKLRPGSSAAQSSDTALVVAIRPTPRATYTAVMARVASGTLTANTLKAVMSFEHAATATKTMRLRQLLVSGYATTAVAGTVEFQISRGTAASTAGNAITPQSVTGTGTAAETTVKSIPTVVAATVVYAGNMTSVPATANSSIGAAVDLLANGDQIEQQPFTLVAGQLQSLVLNIISTAAIAVTLNVTAVFTEE